MALNCHVLEKGPSAAGSPGGRLDRFNLKCVQPRKWISKIPKKRKADAEDRTPGDWEWKDALAAIYDLSCIPNQFVKLVWYCDFTTRPQPLCRLVSPALVWSQTLDLSENHIIQFA